MNRKLKYWIKQLSPFPLSKNHRYDRLTHRILKKCSQPDSNCIDVGCHEGDFIRLALRFAPNGLHWGFEPIPSLYDQLLAKLVLYPNCTIGHYAISDINGWSDFNHVITNPAYSGLKKRSYDRKQEQDEIIRVPTKKLDDLIPDNIKIDFIKIDVEGGEMDVLKGAADLLTTWQPVIFFEFGSAAIKTYEVSPAMIYEYLDSLGYKIFLPERYLKGKSALNAHEFLQQAGKELNYYFVAAPQASVTK